MPEEKKMERFLCPSCSADMEFDPESGEMKCRYCGHKQAVAVAPPAVAGVQPHPFAEMLNQTGTAHLQPVSDQALEVHCSGCGAVVAFHPPEVAGMCSFCGAAIVAEPKAADPLIAPDGVLPVKVPKTLAQKEVQQWLASRWFAPNALKKLAHQEGIGGVYLPFWSYDSDTDSRYRGERGEHYYETEWYTDSDGKQQTRQVQHTRWYPASGRVARHFDDVLIAATRSVSENRLNKLQPWDLNALCPYEPAYLAGFKAQRYQVELPAGFETAKQVMGRVIESDVRRDIGGDEQRIASVDTDYSNVMFRHLLLPVWIGAYKFQNKVYQVMVNARTGEVQGERPYSTAKILSLILFIIALILVIAVLNQK
jgi:DNA-directed RNA polymerase subunit RPC12/RpoP